MFGGLSIIVAGLTVEVFFAKIVARKVATVMFITGMIITIIGIIITCIKAIIVI